MTGGGIVGNLPRVLPAGLGAALERRTWSEPRIFEEIRRLGRWRRTRWIGSSTGASA